MDGRPKCGIQMLQQSFQKYNNYNNNIYSRFLHKTLVIESQRIFNNTRKSNSVGQDRLSPVGVTVLHKKKCWVKSTNCGCKNENGVCE